MLAQLFLLLGNATYKSRHGMVRNIVLDKLQDKLMTAESFVVVSGGGDKVNSVEVLWLNIILALATLLNIFLDRNSCLQEVLAFLELPFLEVYAP